MRMGERGSAVTDRKNSPIQVENWTLTCLMISFRSEWSFDGVTNGPSDGTVWYPRVVLPSYIALWGNRIPTYCSSNYKQRNHYLGTDHFRSPE